MHHCGNVVLSDTSICSFLLLEGGLTFGHFVARWHPLARYTRQGRGVSFPIDRDSLHGLAPKSSWYPLLACYDPHFPKRDECPIPGRMNKRTREEAKKRDALCE